MTTTKLVYAAVGATFGLLGCGGIDATGDADINRTVDQAPTNTPGPNNDAEDALPPADEALTSACERHGASYSAGGIKPTQAVDYLAVRLRALPPGDQELVPLVDGWAAQTFEVKSEAGTPCGTATGTQCETKVALHPIEFLNTYPVITGAELSIVTTRGDDVVRYSGAAGAGDLFGEIDTLDEAILLAEMDGRSTCGGFESADGTFRVYELRFSVCAPLVTTIHEMEVGRDGAMRELQTAEFSRQEGPSEGCI